MAVSLSVGDIIRARVWSAFSGAGGGAAVNTLHYVVAAVGGVPATDRDVATFIDSVVAAQYKDLMTDTADYRGIQAQILVSTPPYRAKFGEQFEAGSQGPGTAGSTPLPAQICGLISFGTDLAGPASRGRFYVAYPDASDDSGGGSPTAGYLTRLAALAGNVGVGLGVVESGRTATLVRVLLHRENKDLITPPPTPVQTTVLSAFWATQRKRGAFGRSNKSPI